MLGESDGDARAIELAQQLGGDCRAVGAEPGCERPNHGLELLVVLDGAEDVVWVWGVLGAGVIRLYGAHGEDLR